MNRVQRSGISIPESDPTTSVSGNHSLLILYESSGRNGRFVAEMEWALPLEVRTIDFNVRNCRR